MSDIFHIYERTPDTVFLAFFSICISCIIFIISAFYQWKFLRLSQHPFIKKRYPFLVFFYTLNNELFILFERTCSALIRTGIYSPLWFQWFRWILFVFFLHTSSFSFLLRVYLLFYNIQFSKANDSNEWKNYIKNENSNQSFFIKYKSTLGSIYYIYKWFILIWFLSVILVIIILLTIDFYHSSLCDSIIFVLTCILLAIFWLNTPMFHDQFLIRTEIKYILLVYALILIHYIIYTITGLVFHETFISWFITHCFTTIFIAIFNTFSLIWPIYKYTKMRYKSKHNIDESVVSSYAMSGVNDINNNDIGNSFTLSLQNLPPITDEMERERSNDPMYIQVKITDIIKEEIGFNAFIKHLMKEFSIENILAVVEMTQFKQRFNKILKTKQKLKQKNSANMDHERNSSLMGNVANKLRNSLREKMFDVMQLTQTKSDTSEKEEEEYNDEYDGNDNDNINNNLSVKHRTSQKILIDIRSDIIELPLKLPKSTIVWNNYGEENSMNECKKIIILLYKK
eukprot:171058_1